MAFPEPRQHPYLFAHATLRDALAKRPERLMDALAGPDAADALAQLWARTGEGLEPEERLPTPDLQPHLRRLPSGWLLAAIPLPSPEEVGECFAAAILYRPPASRLLFLKTAPEAHLFVLERGFDREDGTRRAYVAAYRPDGRRERLGDLAPPELDPFLAFIAARDEARAAFDSGAGR